MARSLFSKGFLQQIGLHAQIREHALQPAVLVLEALHLADHGRIHAAILRPPLNGMDVSPAISNAAGVTQQNGEGNDSRIPWN